MLSAVARIPNQQQGRVRHHPNAGGFLVVVVQVVLSDWPARQAIGGSRKPLTMPASPGGLPSPGRTQAMVLPEPYGLRISGLEPSTVRKA